MSDVDNLCSVNFHFFLLKYVLILQTMAAEFIPRMKAAQSEINYCGRNKDAAEDITNLVFIGRFTDNTE